MCDRVFENVLHLKKKKREIFPFMARRLWHDILYTFHAQVSIRGIKFEMLYCKTASKRHILHFQAKSIKISLPHEWNTAKFYCALFVYCCVQKAEKNKMYIAFSSKIVDILSIGRTFLCVLAKWPSFFQSLRYVFVIDFIINLILLLSKKNIKNIYRFGFQNCNRLIEPLCSV